MSTGSSKLDLRIHLVDGNVLRFEQDDSVAIEKILDSIHPDKVFGQRQVVIAGSYSMSTLMSAAIARIDVITDRQLSWPFHFTATDVVDITEQEFRQQYRPEDRHVIRTERVLQPGQLIMTWSEIELLNGERIYIKVQVSVEPRTPLDVSMFLQQLLSAHSLHGRHRDGGAWIINPQNILRVTFFPGPPQTPPGAWPAHHVSG